MKINTVSHKNAQKERLNDIPRSRHTKDKSYHPFMQEREYVKALNAVKIERLLAKPFVGAFSYHKEGITCISKNQSNDVFASASFNGQVFVWDLKASCWSSEISLGEMVGGLSFSPAGLFVGSKNSILCYDDTYRRIARRYRSAGSINSLSFFFDLVVSTTCGVEVLDVEKKILKNRYGSSSVSAGSFNKSMGNSILGFCENRSLVFVDHRIGQEFLRINAGIRNNCLQFNPRDGQLVASGNEDHSLYIHDIRYPTRPYITFSQHVNAICSLDFDAFGKNIATGSCDRTVRIFDIEKRVCKDVYYNKRMHNVNGVRYSTSSDFIVSGSDDGSLRIWKTEASKKLGPLSRREKENYYLSDALKSKFKDVCEIRRIKNHRFLPKPLKNKIKNAAERRKREQEKNRGSRKIG